MKRKLVMEFGLPLCLEILNSKPEGADLFSIFIETTALKLTTQKESLGDFAWILKNVYLKFIRH